MRPISQTVIIMALATITATTLKMLALNAQVRLFNFIHYTAMLFIILTTDIRLISCSRNDPNDVSTRYDWLISCCCLNLMKQKYIKERESNRCVDMFWSPQYFYDFIQK